MTNRELRVVILMIPLLVIVNASTVIYLRYKGFEKNSEMYAKGYKDAILDCIDVDKK